MMHPINSLDWFYDS